MSKLPPDRVALDVLESVALAVLFIAVAALALTQLAPPLP